MTLGKYGRAGARILLLAVFVVVGQLLGGILYAASHVSEKRRLEKVGTGHVNVKADAPGMDSQAAGGRRRLTEADAIRMTLIAGPDSDRSYANMLTKDFASFSPDGRSFVVLLKKGNLENNTNEYSMVLFRTDEVLRSAKPRTLVKMASSSNREAIQSVTWLKDNDTILFLGEHPGETSQIYSVQCSTGIVKRLSNHPTSVVAYSSDAKGDEIVYAAERPLVKVASDKVLREGFAVGDEAMSDVIAGEIHDDLLYLFVTKAGEISSRSLAIPPGLQGELARLPHFFLSPDGRNVVVELNLTDLPEAWRQYDGEALLKRVLTHKVAKGKASWVFRYGIIDTETGRARVLLDAPVGYHGAEVAWSPDGASVVLTGVYLPISDPAQADPSVAQGKTFVAEVNLDSLRYSVIAHQNLKFINWDPRNNVITFEDRTPELSRDTPARSYYAKADGAWKKLDKATSEDTKNLPEILAEQSLNDPPKIVARNRSTGEKALLLDLNPQFAQIQLGREEAIKYTIADGSEIQAGLYLPPDFDSSKKYPLVVQTHGFDPNGFWVDGSFTTGFAAQALAAKGMLVLQIPDLHKWDETTEEAPNMSDVLKRGIDVVEKRGILDRERVGIIGFSRTGLYVHYMLTHEGFHIAAAVVADGTDAGYSSYIQFLGSSPYTADDSEMIIGGLPWGPAISLWVERSPEFLLQKVQAPLLLQAPREASIGFEWAFFQGLRRLGKPVELVYLPGSSHIIQKPWNRMVSQQGDVDWFCFWLKGEEDPDPAKKEEYTRWRELRKLKEEASAAGSLH